MQREVQLIFGRQQLKKRGSRRKENVRKKQKGRTRR